jgi:sulfate adenylyltransferase subunit 1 (EFTu-like GTPase family)
MNDDIRSDAIRQDEHGGVHSHSRDLDEAIAGQSVTLTLEDEVDCGAAT